MLQRQIMFKQLEELQRQKKLQELNDSTQQNVINQQPLIHNKQASRAQYAPPLINGTPVRDASQLFMFGNTNLGQGFPNGSPYSHVNLASHHVNRFSHFPREPSTGEQVDTISRSSMSDQFNVPYPERSICGPVFSQGQNGQQEEGGDWNSEKTANINNPSQEFTTLDPMEQKFLFNSDDNSLGGFGSMFEDTEALPSLQSGSWSALMQSALEETSSTDTAVQEEWSGLSFQNPEISNENNHQIPWQNNNNNNNNNVFQNASALNSREDHLKASNASSSFPNLQKYPSHELNQDSHKDGGELYCSGQQSQPPVEGGAQIQRFSQLQVHQGPSGLGGDFKKGFLTDNQRQLNASELSSFRTSDGSGIMDRPEGFPVPDSSAQTSRHMLELLHKVDKYREYRHGTQSVSAPTTEMPKAEPVDAITPPSNNPSAPQYFGLRLAPPTQRPPGNYFDLSQISQQPDTSHLVPLKNQDDQSQSQSQLVSNSTRQPNVWVDIPPQHNLLNSDPTNASFEPPKDSNNQMNPQGQDGKIHLEEDSFSGSSNGPTTISAFGNSLKQTHVSPHGYSSLNPTYSDPNIRAPIKHEKIDSSEIKLPQITSMSQLTSAYETYKTLLANSGGRDNQLVKNISLLEASSQPPHRNSSFVHMNLVNTSQHGSVWPVMGTAINPYAVNQLQHLDVSNQDSIVSKSKKRKCPTYELLPWHKEAAKGSSRVYDISIGELEWAQAAKRVPEKVKEEETIHRKKRIILTTQLMQVLFRPTPPAILSDDANTCYNTATYFAARLTLGDACSLANHSHTPLGENVISKGKGDKNLSKIIEEFIDRSKKLEDQLFRLENGGSILEIRMESQDLERFSVINRFAKFHSRAQMVATPSSAVPKLYPQRYVTASPMPKIVPQGHNCLSL